MVTNVDANQIDVSVANTFSVFVDQNDDGNSVLSEIIETSDSSDIVIAEPVITMEKDLSITPMDAGDPVQYSLLISNNGSGANKSTAFEITVTDEFDTYVNAYQL